MSSYSVCELSRYYQVATVIHLALPLVFSTMTALVFVCSLGQSWILLGQVLTNSLGQVTSCRRQDMKARTPPDNTCPPTFKP